MRALGAFDIVEAKVAAADLETVDVLAAFGFRFCEGEAAFAWDVDSAVERGRLRLAAEKDVPVLRDIAGRSFTFSRFRPPWYTVAEREHLYRQWAQNAVHGVHDDVCLIAGEGRRTSGFVTLRDLGPEGARVGLLAVAPGHAGQGVGIRLVRAALGWCADRGAGRLEVATQTGNLNAMRFYQAQGAQITGVSLWMYR